MPLHLLGKKSWNVYNTANIERVRRDEEAARQKEQAEEQRMQEQDAERRLAILRGEVPPPLPEPEHQSITEKPSFRESREPRKKRNRQGEDDTDFELRLARERQEQQYRHLQGPSPSLTSNVPDDLVDSKGHLTLFAPQQTHEKHPEVEKEKKQLAENSQLRLGPGSFSGAGDAWYATADDQILSVVPSKNVFGKDDPNRKAREQSRLVSSDPLAMMKSGAAKVRELEKERKKINEERERELRELKKTERRERRHRHMRTEVIGTEVKVERGTETETDVEAGLDLPVVT
ncbi:hypothetical protein QBC40DRAFT_260586 [Triangularia verruculosa]|uniref:CBF1-interacting co-repressor CIR N-terminal domain-containing protein n=1 Tax=Triangularia verruculosa TaxID=2587418 RepID=A0AAN6XSD3_9PEZI|nr:hypothetical protein QBC40DRAFT_260586 [Triangularia verruculosa]